jgi:polar amino acid transport system substrate-binding protein
MAALFGAADFSLFMDEKMKKSLLLLAAALSASTFLIQAPAVAATAIVIGLDDHFPPMGFRDDKNEIVGFDVDLAREAGKRLGLEVSFKPIDWSAKEAELNGRRIDVLWNGLTITEERKANILFTKPYLENRQIIMVPVKSPIQAKADLAGKIVGVQDGSSAVDAVNKDAGTAKSLKELKKFSDNVTALMDLSAGRLDAVVMDEIVGRYYVGKKADEYRILTDHFGTEEYGVGVRKGDTELAGKLDQALDDMKADGVGKEISLKWFGADILKR